MDTSAQHASRQRLCSEMSSLLSRKQSIQLKCFCSLNYFVCNKNEQSSDCLSQTEPKIEKKTIKEIKQQKESTRNHERNAACPFLCIKHIQHSHKYRQCSLHGTKWQCERSFIKKGSRIIENEMLQKPSSISSNMVKAPVIVASKRALEHTIKQKHRKYTAPSLRN